MVAAELFRISSLKKKKKKKDVFGIIVGMFSPLQIKS